MLLCNFHYCTVFSANKKYQRSIVSHSVIKLNKNYEFSFIQFIKEYKYMNFLCYKFHNHISFIIRNNALKMYSTVVKKIQHYMLKIRNINITKPIKSTLHNLILCMYAGSTTPITIHSIHASLSILTFVHPKIPTRTYIHPSLPLTMTFSPSSPLWLQRRFADNLDSARIPRDLSEKSRRRPPYHLRHLSRAPP